MGELVFGSQPRAQGEGSVEVVGERGRGEEEEEGLEGLKKLGGGRVADAPQPREGLVVRELCGEGVEVGDAEDTRGVGGLWRSGGGGEGK